MAAWIASGRLVDAILVLTLVEWLGIGLYHHRTGRGPSPSRIGSILLPGMFLLIALRAALVSAGWPWVATALAASLVAHLADLARRWSL